MGLPVTALNYHMILSNSKVPVVFIITEIFHWSSACGINLGSSVIITGGRYSLTKVTEYNEEGFVRYLPSLQQTRYQHGCSYYVNEGTKVDNNKINKLWEWFFISEASGRYFLVSFNLDFSRNWWFHWRWQCSDILNWTTSGHGISLGLHRRASLLTLSA